MVRYLLVILWILLPLMEPFTLGMRATLGITALLWVLTGLLGGQFPPGYAATLKVVSLFVVSMVRFALPVVAAALGSFAPEVGGNFPPGLGIPFADGSMFRVLCQPLLGACNQVE